MAYETIHTYYTSYGSEIWSPTFEEYRGMQASEKKIAGDKI
jgi:hypothetical protein